MNAATFLPADEAFAYNGESIFLNDQSYNAVGKKTMWGKTMDGKYVAIFVTEADANSVTFKYAYPYGDFTWE